MHLYLDMLSQWYGVRTLLARDKHPCKKQLLDLLERQGPHPKNGCRRDRIAALLRKLILKHPPLEKTADREHPRIQAPEIS